MTKRVKFPLKLFNAIQNEKNNSIISWDEDGKNIIIKDKNKLISLLKYKSYKAFHRQLNLYGFKKLPSLENNTSEVYFLEDFNNTSNKIKEIKKIDLKKILDEIQNNKNIEDKIDSYISLIEQSKNKINDNLLSDVLSFLVERKKQKEMMLQEINKLKKFYDKNSKEIEGSDKNQTMYVEIEEEEK